MLQRVFLAAVASAIVGHSLTIASPETTAAANTMNVAVRVYRMSDRGVYHFYPGVTVKLNDGRVGTTGSGNSMPGVAYFYKVPVRDRYSAQALVNGRWISATSFDKYGPTLRINVQVK